MLERGIDKFAVATIWDPIAVTFCLAAGEGAKLPLRFGGKAGPDGGAPIDALVEVLRAVPESWQSFGASRVTLGASALVRLAGSDIDVILNTNRTQTFEPDIFSNLGVAPASKDILLVKSTTISTPASRRSRKGSSISTRARPIPRVRGRRNTRSCRARSGREWRIRT